MDNEIPNASFFPYAAFLRGINVGEKQIKMDKLKDAFNAWGYHNVSTILASGNIIFDTQSADPKAVRQIITNGIKTAFGFEVSVFIRSIEELMLLTAKNPFAGFNESAQTKLYVTFLDQKVIPEIKIPYQSLGEKLVILSVTDREIFSVVTLTMDFGTSGMMVFLEKEFGSELTTRNWNTTIKILDLYQKTHR